MLLSLFCRHRMTSRADYTEIMAAPDATSLETDSNADLAVWPGKILSGQLLQQVLQRAREQATPLLLGTPQAGVWQTGQLLEIDNTRHTLYLRQQCASRIPTQLKTGARFNVLFRTADSYIFLSLTVTNIDNWQQQARLVTALPDWGLTSQMRTWHRTRPSSATCISANICFPNGQCGTSRVIDISEGGLGLLLPQPLLHEIQPLECWPQATLHTGNLVIGPFSLTVSNLRIGTRQVHVGVAITDCNEMQMQVLRRLLLQLQSNHG